MASRSASTLAAVRSAYQNAGRVQQDADSILNQMVSLKCRVQQLVEPTGHTHQLLQLHGTVPIFYRGSQYNIPVEVWFLPEHPLKPPRCYVVPTAGMAIKPRHKHVDSEGLVYMPYLSAWTPQSDIQELFMYMSSVFGDDPPVYAKPKSSPPPVQAHAGASPSAGFGAGAFNPGMSAQPSVDPVAERKRRLMGTVTEKLKARHGEFNEEVKSEFRSLMRAQRTLAASKQRIDDGMDALRREVEVLEVTIADLEEENRKVAEFLEENEDEAGADGDADEAVVSGDEEAALKHIDVDDMIKPVGTWSEQLIEAVAHDRAIDDVMFELDEALREDRIELKEYLKQVRKLAVRQFSYRALATEIFQRLSKYA